MSSSTTKVVLEHHHTYLLISAAAFPLQWPSGVIVTETVNGPQAKIFSTWFFSENVC